MIWLSRPDIVIVYFHESEGCRRRRGTLARSISSEFPIKIEAPIKRIL